MHERFILLSIQILGVFVIMSGCTDELEIDHGVIASVSQPLFQTGNLWGDGIVHVCYDAADGNNPALLLQARYILDEIGWSAVANVTFTGWGACDDSPQIAPQSRVRVHFQAGSRGMSNVGMIPSFPFFPGTTNLTLVSDDSGQHFTYEVLHEFGHAIGFAHEMVRPDNWVDGVIVGCAPDDGESASDGTYLTPYFDFHSVMNYCMGWTTSLSPGDVAGVRAAYGTRSAIVKGQNSSNNSISRTSNNLDTYFTHADGSIWASWWYAGLSVWPWPTGPVTSSATDGMPVGKPIASVSRTPDNLDIFFAGNDGALHTSFWYTGAAGYTAYTVPGTAGRLQPGQQVAAVSTSPTQIDIYYAGTDNRLYRTTWMATNMTSSNWCTIALSSAGVAPTGAAVTAVSRNADNADLFWIGSDHSLHSAYCYGQNCWRDTNCGTVNWPTFRVTANSACNAPVGGNLSAAARTPGNIDVFWISSSGATCTSYWSSGGGWTTYSFGSSLANPGAQISAVTRSPNNLDVFVAGTNGSVYNEFWYAGSAGWGLSQTTSTSLVGPGSTVGAAARTPNNLDLFMSNNNGRVWTSYWYTGADGWTAYETN
jgi:hypothetical protein